MHFFPAVDPGTGADDLAAERHVRIHVTNVVDERAAEPARDECSGDPGDGRIGHRQDDVGAQRNGPRDGESEIGEVIRDTAAHAMAGIGGGTDALNYDTVAFLTAQK